MFGRRPDGKRIDKGTDGLTRMSPLFLGPRTQATNFFEMEIPAKSIDDYIEKKRKDGIEYNYRDIVIATLVRTFYARPKLNQFVMNGHFYQRKYIDVSMIAHKSLRSGEDETTVKIRFSGKETIAEVKQKVDTAIKKAVETKVSIDGFTDLPSKMPTWVLKLIVWLTKRLDKRGMLSDKFIFNTSPFHASIFFADLRSIKLNAVYHHLYDFGNCGFFCVLGKDKIVSHVDEKTGETSPERMVHLRISEDERFIDGLYYTGMIRFATRMIENLAILEAPPEDFEVRKTKQMQIRDKKLAKKAARKSKKKKG